MLFGTPAMLDAARPPVGPDGLALADAARLPLILPGEGHGLRDLIKRQAMAVGAELNAVIDVDSYQNIKDLVIEVWAFPSCRRTPSSPRSVRAGCNRIRSPSR